MNHKALESNLENLLKRFPKEQVLAYYPRRIITPMEYENAQESIQAYVARSVAQQNQDKSDEYKFGVYIFGLVLKLLLIISTKPNALIDSLDQPPARKQRVRKNGTIKADALWNPCFIGKGYSAKRVGDSGGSGSPMRMHWRRGHLRNQRYGPDWSLVKVICRLNGPSGYHGLWPNHNRCNRHE